MRTHIVPALVFATVLASAQFAQAQTWVPLVSGSPPGTPATVTLDAAASTPQTTWIDVRVFGYWQSIVTVAGSGTFQRIEVPGLGVYGQEGAPGLPAFRSRLGVVTNASTLAPTSTQIVSQVVLSGVNPYPTPQEEQDENPDPGAGPGDPDGSPEVFVQDLAIYGANALWPPSHTSSFVITDIGLGGLRGGDIELYPFRVNPQTQQLVAVTHLRVRFDHGGVATQQPALTSESDGLIEATCFNYPEIEPWITADTPAAGNRYLIVTKSAYVPTLQSFIDYRKACGYVVTVITTDALAGTCISIRTAIAQWASAGNPSASRYCLLVGDESEIPLCPSPTVNVKMGDDAYGSPAGVADLVEEVFVGRLSVDSTNDLANQLNKIRAYELDQDPNSPYDRAVLVAHKEGAPGKYEGAHETVANAAYAVQPLFTKIYGSQFLSSNIGIRAALSSGCGVLAYRGHGSTNTFYDWNVQGQNFHKDELLLLNNQPTEPVIWSFSCTNSNIAYDTGSVDCIGEAWLENPFNGAVAHYGSTTTSGTSQNHVLDREMFKAIYGLGLTTHSHAIAYAETKMNQEKPGLNSWMYHLLGDPVMKVRRKKPKPLFLTLPPVVPTCTGPSCTLTVIVKDGNGIPQPGVLVSAWKPSWPPTANDEILASATSGTGGVAVIPLGPQTLTTIRVTGRDDEGNVATGTVKVKNGAWTALGGGKYGGNGKAPALGGTGTLQIGQPANINLHDAPPSAMCLLIVSTNETPTPFFEGTLHAFPIVSTIALFSDAAGNLPIPIPAWPASIPSNTTLVLQYAIDDPGASLGVGLSNGLRADTP